MGDDQQWGNHKNHKNGNNNHKQKQSGQQFNEKKQSNYSPSTSYNFQNGKARNKPRNIPRRRIDRYKRESIGSYDKLIKQNDVIIRLLKEIRDRLPETPRPKSDIVEAAPEKQPVVSEQPEHENTQPENTSESEKNANVPQETQEEPSIAESDPKKTELSSMQ